MYFDHLFLTIRDRFAPILLCLALLPLVSQLEAADTARVLPLVSWKTMAFKSTEGGRYLEFRDSKELFLALNSLKVFYFETSGPPLGTGGAEVVLHLPIKKLRQKIVEGGYEEEFQLDIYNLPAVLPDSPDGAIPMPIGQVGVVFGGAIGTRMLHPETLSPGYVIEVKWDVADAAAFYKDLSNGLILDLVPMERSGNSVNRVESIALSNGTDSPDTPRPTLRISPK